MVHPDTLYRIKTQAWHGCRIAFDLLIKQLEPEFGLLLIEYDITDLKRHGRRGALFANAFSYA